MASTRTGFRHGIAFLPWILKAFHDPVLIAFFLTLSHSVALRGQTITVQSPDQLQGRVGVEMVFKLKVTGIRKYRIAMEGNPPTSRIDNNRFIWTPKLIEKRNYQVQFHLLDSAGVEVNETDVALTIESPDLSPLLVFDQHLADTIFVNENEPLILTARLESRTAVQHPNVMSYFLFNEDPGQRSFDSCRITRLGDRLMFNWVPSNREALRTYARLRITLVEQDKYTSTYVLNFRIANVNQKPRFKTFYPDTLFLSNEDISIDFSAFDPDNDNLTYDFSPKNSLYTIAGSKITFKHQSVSYRNSDFPLHLSVVVSDGGLKASQNLVIGKDSRYTLPSLGDFSRKLFAEGDTLLTYLNVSNDWDAQPLEIKYNDLTLPSGIGSISRHLVFERKPSYIKVHSKGVLPYNLVDRDFTYNVAVSVSSKTGDWPPVFKVLELTVEDVPDPADIGRQKDTVMSRINRFLEVEQAYKSDLEKIQHKISRPWWKTVAAITGTLSGVLIFIQAQDPNQAVSISSASISLISIVVTNIPNLSEKALTELSDKIANSKSRIESLQEKASEFKAALSFDIEQSDLDKIKSETEELLFKSQTKRNSDICAILSNKGLKRRIERATGRQRKNKSKDLKASSVFHCAPPGS